MDPLVALGFSFLLGLAHGILPDEHTWPITFSYAIGSSSGREGMKAGIYFSAAFALQRALMSQIAYFALAPFFRSETFNGIVFIAVGIAMGVAGAVVLYRNRELHVHLFGHHHEAADAMERSLQVLGTRHGETVESVKPPPVRWTFVHGFIAGFGFEGFAIYPLTQGVNAMPTPWLGFLPGLVFGLGTMVVLIVLGALFGTFLRLAKSVTEAQIRAIGIQTSGRTLFYGGIFFGIFGLALLSGITEHIPFDADYLLIGVFMAGIAIPAFIYSWRKVKADAAQDAGRATEGAAMERQLRYGKKGRSLMTRQFDVIAASGGVIEEFTWGRLRWISNSALHPGAAMTVGECLILPGKENTHHAHPNCEEVLLVLSGECDHAAGDETVHLTPGMAIRVSAGVPHYARCTSWDPLKAVIMYSSPDRRTDVTE